MTYCEEDHYTKCRLWHSVNCYWDWSVTLEGASARLVFTQSTAWMLIPESIQTVSRMAFTVVARVPSETCHIIMKFSPDLNTPATDCRHFPLTSCRADTRVRPKNSEDKLEFLKPSLLLSDMSPQKAEAVSDYWRSWIGPACPTYLAV